MSSHNNDDDDDFIEFETPSAAAITVNAEMNAKPEIDDKPKQNTKNNINNKEQPQSDKTQKTTSTTPEITTTSANIDPESTTSITTDVIDSPPTTTTTTTTSNIQTRVDNEIVDETELYNNDNHDSEPTIITTNNDPTPDNINSEIKIDEFGNPIVIETHQFNPADLPTFNLIDPPVREEEEEEGIPSDFPPYHTHGANGGENGDMNELYEEEMNFDPDPERASEAKARGNKHFANGQYEEALECYAEALLFCPEDMINERILYHNNKCAGHVMLKQWEDSIFEAHCVLGLDPVNTKALTRRAKAYEQTEQYQEAIEDYKALAEIDPKVRLYREKEAELTKKNEEKFEKQKTEMVDKLKGWGNSFLGMFGLSTDNFQFQQDPNTGSYSVNFNQNPGETPPPAAAAAAAAAGSTGQSGQSGGAGGSSSFSFTSGGGGR